MSEIKILITDEDLCAPRRLLSRRDKKLARARSHLREFRVSRALKARQILYLAQKRGGQNDRRRGSSEAKIRA